MKTVNITLKIEDDQINNFDEWLRLQLEVISFKILPNTEKMYNDDNTFKKLVKSVKQAQKIRDVYINDNNQKHLQDEN